MLYVILHYSAVSNDIPQRQLDAYRYLMRGIKGNCEVKEL